MRVECRMFSRSNILAVLLLTAVPAWSKVLFRWTESSVPPAANLGVDELVVPLHAKALIGNARKAGYRVCVDVPLSQVNSAAASRDISKLGAIFLDSGEAGREQVSNALGKLRAAFPRIPVRVLDSRAQQPEMKGQMVTTRDGVLQVSSATAQPWISSNLPLVRLDQVLHFREVPLYGFQWNPPENSQPDQEPDEDGYLLAVAEAGAFHADLVLALHEKLQKALLRNNKAAWETLAKIRRYAGFASPIGDGLARPAANVGLVIEDYESSYEAINLLARHNVSFHLLRSPGWKATSLEGLSVLVILKRVNKEEVQPVEDFATKGGVVVLLDSHSPYPWQFDRPLEEGGPLVTHDIGKGRIIQMGDPAADPESFAQDIPFQHSGIRSLEFT